MRGCEETVSYHYGDIPDDFPSKTLIPLGEHIWKLIQELGHEYWTEKMCGTDIGFVKSGSDFMHEKFKIAVDSAKKSYEWRNKKS